MDRYLLNDILEERSYSEWRELISQLNQEYHNKVYYGEREHAADDCLRCPRSDAYLWNWLADEGECIRSRPVEYVLWNWREKDWVSGRIYRVYLNEDHLGHTNLGINLPKNY